MESKEKLLFFKAIREFSDNIAKLFMLAYYAEFYNFDLTIYLRGRTNKEESKQPMGMYR